MRQFPGQGKFEHPFEWNKVEGMTSLLNTTVDEMKLNRDYEWVEEVIKEAAALLPESILEGQESDYLAEYILGLSAARNALVVASYCFRFLKGQGLIAAEKADYVDAKLEDLESELGEVTDTLRASLASGQGQHSNN